MTRDQDIGQKTDEQRKRLEASLSCLGLSVNEHQKKQMIKMIEELMRWNKTYNLTAIRDSDQAFVQHLFDSLSVVKPLSDFLKARGHVAPRIMDVGSGAGLPGIVLAIAMPNAHVTCVDAVEKKISFIRQMRGALGLDNLDAVHDRVEDMQIKPSQVVISRAFASMKDFVKLAGKHLARDGRIAAMKGKIPVEEIQELSKDDDWIINETVRLDVPELHAERCLVWIEKKGNT